MTHYSAGDFERYLLRMIGAARAARMEKHVGECSRCAGRLRDTRIYVEAMKKELGRPKTRKKRSDLR